MQRFSRFPQVFKRLSETSSAIAPACTIKLDGGGTFSQMRNGMAVYTTDYGGPIAQLLLAFRAGSRYEESDESGVAHHLLNSVGSDSEDSPGSDLLNQCSSLGAKLNSHLTREIFAVQATVVRENAVRMAPVLTELCHLAIKPWDFDNINDAVKKEVLYKEPHKMLLNCLYHAAFRNTPLGNRLWAGDDSLSEINCCMLRKFVVGFLLILRYKQSRLVSGQAAFIGINVDHLNLLERLEEGVKIREEAGKYGIQSEYFGGEARRQLNSSKAYVAIAGEGASFQDPEGLAAQSVLLALLSNPSPIKYGQDHYGIVADSVFKASGLYPFEMSRINEIYWDTSLVGFCISGEAHMITPLIHAAVTSLKSADIDDADIHSAKTMAIMECLLKSESSSDTAFWYATQLLGCRKVRSPAEFASLIKEVTKEDVDRALWRMRGELTMASVGNVRHVPYLDEMV